MTTPTTAYQYLRNIQVHLSDVGICLYLIQDDLERLNQTNEVPDLRIKLERPLKSWGILLARFRQRVQNAAGQLHDKYESDLTVILRLLQIACVLFASSEGLPATSNRRNPVTVILDLLPDQEFWDALDAGTSMVNRRQRVKELLTEARMKWNGFLDILGLKLDLIGSGDGIARFIMLDRPVGLVFNHADEMVELVRRRSEYTVDIGEGEDRTIPKEVGSSVTLGEAMSRVYKETRTLYSMDDYDLEAQSLKEGAECWSIEDTTFSSAGTPVMTTAFVSIVPVGSPN
ncbi:hypothetical protein QFC20_002676 [Naganishia adeliensis]|uniref:Uncharacterized protein n=1 Tax=Naganishia adeliensis TaxID=92952 RepID=A0ACC2WKU9_9TREE|nr:hypothetical protein QFC20_002676 [Naganishia adeliensis]